MYFPNSYTLYYIFPHAKSTFYIVLLLTTYTNMVDISGLFYYALQEGSMGACVRK